MEYFLFQQCGAGFRVEHVVKLNVSEEEEKRMREEMVERRRQAKMAKVVYSETFQIKNTFLIHAVAVLFLC